MNQHSTVKIFTGLDIDKFNMLSRSLPSLHSVHKNPITASNALFVYLMKLRTGHTNEEIAAFSKMPRTTMQNRMTVARKALLQDFVPQNLGTRSRDDLLQHITPLSRALYCPNELNVVILIWDGTYIYIDKSSNMEFQKKTYNDHKKRNYIKPMMCVTPDGFIANVFGPYPAIMNDASILNKIMTDETETLAYLQPGDVMVLDRGFRDSLDLLHEKKFVVKMPSFTNTHNINASLTSSQANFSRLVTKVRYTVETRNGHLKTVWKLFDSVWCNLSIPHMMHDLKIAAALLNKFFNVIISDKDLHEVISQRMIGEADAPNKLSKIINKPEFQRNICKFQCYENYTNFPVMTEDDLVLITVGTYQVRLAPGYCQEHMKANDNQFVAFICPDDLCKNHCQELYTSNNNPVLILAKMKSRYSSRKYYYTFVLFDKNVFGSNSILGYCCDCKTGLRTIGCCSHVVCVIWYFGFAIHLDEIKKPAAFLNNYFEKKIEL